jgi:hypothetical protein
MSERDRKIVGSPLNFRGLVYGPINEQGVLYLFGLIANDLNIRVESIQQGYPDCTAIRYAGKGKWERINIEFEFKSSNFDHDPDKCDVLVCWEDFKTQRLVLTRAILAETSSELAQFSAKLTQTKKLCFCPSSYNITENQSVPQVSVHSPRWNFRGFDVSALLRRLLKCEALPQWCISWWSQR